MLKTMRKNSTRLIWIVVGIFVLFGVGGTIVSTTKSRHFVGEVYGKKISDSVFESTYRMVYYSPRIQNLIQSKQEVTNQLLEDSTFQHLAFQAEAKKRNINVTDSNVQDEIVRRFTINGKFDPKVYEHWVTRVTGLPLRLYEEGVRKDLHVAKLLDSIRSEIIVTDEEIHDFYYKQNRSLSVDYISTTVDKFKDQVAYTDTEINTYYQDNISSFRTDKKYQIRYTLFDPSLFKEQVSVSETELIDSFNKVKESLQSPDTPNEPQFSEMKDQLTQMIISQKTKAIAQEEALNFKNSIQNIADFKTTAESMNLAINTTKMIDLESLIEEIGASSELENKINTITPKTLTLIETSRGFCVFQVMNVKDPQTIEFKAARDSVIEKYVHEHALSAAREILDKAYHDLTSMGHDLQDIATDYDLEYKKTDFFSSNDSVIFDPKSTFEIFDVLWNKDKGFNTRPMVLQNDTIGIYRLHDVQDPKIEEFRLAKDGIRKQIREFKQYFEVQQKLSEILQKADIKKYNQKTDISDR